MPIRPENRARYPKDWKALSRRIRFERAGGRCEWCKAPHGKIVARQNGRYILKNGDVFDDTNGTPIGRVRGSEMGYVSYARIVLTVAHLDHAPENNAETNLAALCQKCHNGHDAKMRAAGVKKRARARKAVGDLFDDPA